MENEESRELIRQSKAINSKVPLHKNGSGGPLDVRK